MVLSKSSAAQVEASTPFHYPPLFAGIFARLPHIY
jgi:hypothetical protein